MKRFKIISSILASLLISTSIIGCGEKSTGAESPYYSLNIDGEKEYYDTNDEEVQKAITLTKDFLGYSEEFNYTDQKYLKQLDCYDADTRAYFQQVGYADRITERANSDQLIRTLDQLNITKVEFYTINDVPAAFVECDYITTITSCSADYLARNNYEINTKYKATSKLIIVKENNEWKLTAESSASEKTKVE